jgi:hypothetical protein
LPASQAAHPKRNLSLPITASALTARSKAQNVARLDNMAIRIFAFLICAAGLATAQSFEELKALYEYDRSTPIDMKSKEQADRLAYKLYSVEYANPGNLRIHGLLVLPKRTGRKAAIVWMHSNGMLAWVGRCRTDREHGGGRADRRRPRWTVSAEAEQSREAMIQTVIALRRAVDVLIARDGIDPQRIVSLGIAAAR